MVSIHCVHLYCIEVNDYRRLLNIVPVVKLLGGDTGVYCAAKTELTEAGEDKGPSNDDKGLNCVSVHQSSQATW